MNLRKIWIIARREYVYNFRRRSYLFTAFVLPIITTGAMLIIISLLTQTMQSTSGFKSVGIVDKARIVTDETGSLIVKLPTPMVIVPSEEQAASDLKSHTLDGYYVIPGNFLATGRIDAYNRANLALTDGLNNEITDTIRLALASRIGDPALVERLQDPLRELVVYRPGSSQKLDPSVLTSAFIVPTIFGLLIFMSVTVTSQFLMSGMVEEKENRMMEMFVTSSRPSETLWGKLLGLGALGLTQIGVWAVFGLVVSTLRGTNLTQTLANFQLTPAFLLMALGYFILGYLLFGSVMSGVGALVNAEQEGRQLSSLLGLVGVIPFVLSFSYLTNPNGPLPTFLSLFPFTAPVGMILRASWGTVTARDIALSMGLMIITIALMMWFSAILFRLGMLNYGKRLGLRDVFLAVREGRQQTFGTSSKELSA